VFPPSLLPKSQRKYSTTSTRKKNVGKQSNGNDTEDPKDLDRMTDIRDYVNRL
jgi:hypothetical protein